MPLNASIEPPDFRAIFNELTGLYLLLSPDLRIIAASKAYFTATGRSENIIGAYLFDAFPDSEANGRQGARALRASLERVLQSRSPDSMPLQRYDLVQPDGSAEVRYWSPINSPVFDSSGRLRWLLHRVSDVTQAVSGRAKERRVLELEAEVLDVARRLSSAYDELRAGGGRLRLALEVGGMAVWRFRLRDEDLTITPELNRLIGFEADHGTTLAQVRSGFLPDDPPIREAARQAWSQGRRAFDHQFRYRRHGDGRLIWLHLRAEIICTSDGEPEEVLGVLQDVTATVAVQERQRTLINELNHRVKNNLALVQSLAMRTFRGAGCEPALDRFVERLISLAGAHELLTRREWAGAAMASIVEASLDGLGVDPDRRRIEGPGLDLGPDLAVNLSLALHELGTNAIKYGALSNAGGAVEVSWWLVEPSRLVLLWRERGGPPVTAPTRQGFGSQLLGRIFAAQRGRAELTFAPESLLCRIEVEVPAAAPAAAEPEDSRG